MLTLIQLIEKGSISFLSDIWMFVLSHPTMFLKMYLFNLGCLLFAFSMSARQIRGKDILAAIFHPFVPVFFLARSLGKLGAEIASAIGNWKNRRRRKKEEERREEIERAVESMSALRKRQSQTLSEKVHGDG